MRNAAVLLTALLLPASLLAGPSVSVNLSWEAPCFGFFCGHTDPIAVREEVRWETLDCGRQLKWVRTVYYDCDLGEWSYGDWAIALTFGGPCRCEYHEGCYRCCREHRRPFWDRDIHVHNTIIVPDRHPTVIYHQLPAIAVPQRHFATTRYEYDPAPRSSAPVIERTVTRAPQYRDVRPAPEQPTVNAGRGAEISRGYDHGSAQGRGPGGDDSARNRGHAYGNAGKSVERGTSMPPRRVVR
jgi:hypothetical protein